MRDHASGDGNPHVSKIDGYWNMIFDPLKALNGTRVRDILRDANDDDRRVFNALYWRVDDWMTSRISRRNLSAGETAVQHTKEDVGGVRFAALVRGAVSGAVDDAGWWETKDLPHLLSKIDGGA